MYYSKKTFLNIILSLFMLVFANSCSNENNPTEPEPIPSDNHAPNAPSNPIPEHNSTGQSIILDLSWHCTDPDTSDTLTYSVYFDLSPFPQVVSEQQYETNYDPGTLNSEATYYWKIVAFDNHGDSSISDVWNFATGSSVNSAPNIPSNPNPSDRTIGQPVDVTFSWLCSDPDGDSLSYNVYFDTDRPLTLVSERQSENFYNPDILDSAATYYWQIVAYDSHEDSTVGYEWRFTTVTSEMPICIYYGNVDGSSVSGNINDTINVEVYIQTDEYYIGNLLVCLGAYQDYIDTLLNDITGLHYPLTEWDYTGFRPISYSPPNPSGWFCQPFTGFALIFSDEPAWFHSETPANVITMKMTTVDNPSLAGTTVEAFGPGFDSIQGPSNAGDTMGYDIQVLEFFSQLEFIQ